MMISKAIEEFVVYFDYQLNTKVLTTSHIRNWIRNGALEELEMVVLEGQVFHTMQC